MIHKILAQMNHKKYYRTNFNKQDKVKEKILLSVQEAKIVMYRKPKL